MLITICGSMSSFDKMKEAEKKLNSLGHNVIIPVTFDINTPLDIERISELNGKHMDNITKSDAILVINISKNNIENYIGANTFLEIGYAKYKKKKIFFFNPSPNQTYIVDVIETIRPQIINGDYSKIA